MVAMSKWKWRLQSHQKLGLLVQYKTSLQLALWGETEVITSKSGGTAHRIHSDKVSTSEGNGYL